MDWNFLVNGYRTARLNLAGKMPFYYQCTLSEEQAEDYLPWKCTAASMAMFCFVPSQLPGW